MDSFAASDLTLQDLLPHREGMLLIEEVLQVERRRAVVRCTVRPTWPMAGPEGADALILVWDGQSPGSADMLRRAKQRKLKIHEVIV